MSPEAWGVAALAAILGFVARSLLGRTVENDLRRELDTVRSQWVVEMRNVMEQRDAALAAKASQFETWQAEAQNLRADVAALERENEGLKRECRDATDRSIAFQRAAEAAHRELAFLRPIADSAEKLLDDEKLPGEWAPVRAAIRARKEANRER